MHCVFLLNTNFSVPVGKAWCALALCCALRSATLMWIACYGGDYLSAPIRAFGPTFEYEIPTQMFCRAFLGAEPHPSPHPAPPPHCRYYSKYSTHPDSKRRSTCDRPQAPLSPTMPEAGAGCWFTLPIPSTESHPWGPCALFR